MAAKTYDQLKKAEKQVILCKICKEGNIPFQKLSEEEFLTSIIRNMDYNEDLNLHISPPEGLKTFHSLSNHNEDDPVPINCDYYVATSHIPNLHKPHHSMFHLNLASLGRHKYEMVIASSLLKLDFDIVAKTQFMKFPCKGTKYSLTNC